jgi:hypothetical protein
MTVSHDDLGPPRWRGQPGRLEVWYLTATDPATGTGVWLHHEVVAPSDGTAAHGLGWIAVFPPDAPPSWRRFGPAPLGGADAAWFDAGGACVSARRMVGSTDGASWDLVVEPSGAPPLWTFPRAAWDRELLPGAQVLAGAGTAVSGSVEVDGFELTLAAAPAGSARIYGHGNARRWGWLHADLGGGDLLEIVSGVSTRPVLRTLPPATFLRLRLDGRDLPRAPVAPGKADLALPVWTVRAHFGLRRLRASIELPPDRSIAVPYADPDGQTATCTNSERAVAEIVLERRSGRRWRPERHWNLAGTAHAEVGLRP